MVRRFRLTMVLVGSLATVPALLIPQPAPAESTPPRVGYDIRGEISSTASGSKWTPRISTMEGVEASIAIGDGPREIKLGAIVRPSTQDGCHTALMTLTITKTVEDGKVLKQVLKGTNMHCGPDALPFPGLDPKAGLSSDLRIAIAVTPLVK